MELGENLKRAMVMVNQDLPSVLAQMDRDRFRDLMRLVLRKFTVTATGGPRRRVGEVATYQFTPEFQDFWLTHSDAGVGGTGLEPMTPCV